MVMNCSLASFFAFLMSFAYAAASASDNMCFLLLGIILVCVFSSARPTFVSGLGVCIYHGLCAWGLMLMLAGFILSILSA